MRPITVVAAVAGVLSATVIAQDSGISRLESLGRALRGAPVWRAEYHQEYIADGMSQGEKLTGVVWVAWPDHALFRFGDPVIREMGLDGRNVRLLDFEVPSCDERILSDDEWARVPLAAVLNPQDAMDHFAIFDLDERGFSLVPREPGGVDRVDVLLTKDRLPAEVVVIDPQGAVNRLRFSKWQKTDAPPNGNWLPQPPADLSCVLE